MFLLEEEILNKNLSFEFGDSFQAKYNSSETFIRLDPMLLKRQKVISSFSSDKVDLKFIYPPNWENTYFTINQKKYGYTIPSRPERKNPIVTVEPLENQQYQN